MARAPAHRTVDRTKRMPKDRHRNGGYPESVGKARGTDLARQKAEAVTDAMSEHGAHEDEGIEQTESALTGADLACAFGPSFFLGHLRRFVRDRCPDPQERMPIVQVYLAGGETLDLCHVMAVSPRWVLLAVRDAVSHPDGMAVEVVPYELIRHICIRTREAGGPPIGFAQTSPPKIMTAETLVQTVTARHVGPNHGSSVE
jgi:hypothetical protein